MKKTTKQQAWIVAVDMGYGHLRAANPLIHLAPEKKIIIANNYEGIPKADRFLWESSRKFYEFFSRLNNIPLVGGYLFGIMDSLQKIKEFYPKRDLSKPNGQINQFYTLMKLGWGKDLIELLNTKDIPLITTFFLPAFFAEEHGFKNNIYVVICDADISRTWVAKEPRKSRIHYLAPCRRVAARLKLYGVPKNNIHVTGFPLPDENLGGAQLRILKDDLAERIVNLDPEHRYRVKYSSTIKQFLKRRININAKHKHPLTLTFAVGGAGAQRLIGKQILFSLRNKLLKKDINLNLVAGSRNDVYKYFYRVICGNGLKKVFRKNLNIIFEVNKVEYFKTFNKILRQTDILWTKPSELSFYTALGLPIIMAPTIGSQEEFNKQWLYGVGGGLMQDDPRYTHEWLFDWVESGWLAEAAMSGFLDGRQFGVSNIKKVVFEGIVSPAQEYQLL